MKSGAEAFRLEQPRSRFCQFEGNWHPASIGFRWPGRLNYLGLQCAEETMGHYIIQSQIVAENCVFKPDRNEKHASEVRVRT